MAYLFPRKNLPKYAIRLSSLCIISFLKIKEIKCSHLYLFGNVLISRV